MTRFTIAEDIHWKRLRSADYNYDFNKDNGFFARWGHLPADDPDWSPFGPEIADIEVTTICRGPSDRAGGRQVCKFCYKANTPVGENMSLETFKALFERLPRTLTQIAIGADASCTANPEIWDMMRFCREHPVNPVIPNITVAEADDETAAKLAASCGAVAVSRYANKDLCYDTVARLVASGLKQVNIHQMLSLETLAQARETVLDIKRDPRLRGLRAIVFLSLKQKGRGIKHTPLTQELFAQLFRLASALRVPFGLDSCSAPKFLEVVKDDSRYPAFLAVAEPCESSLFSVYTDVRGRYHPCSFTPGHPDWGSDGLDVINCSDFVRDIWMHPATTRFRKCLIENLNPVGVRACPLYTI